MSYEKIVFVFLSVLVCFSCDSDSSIDDVCTPVDIDHYKVMWGDIDVTPPYTPYEYLMARKYGKYVILNDTYRKDMEELTGKILVKGFIWEEKFLKKNTL